MLEIEFVEFQPIVGWIKIEEGIWTIEALHYLLITETLDLDTVKSVVSGAYELVEPVRAQRRQPCRLVDVAFTADASTKAELLKVKKTARTKDIGEALWRRI